MGVRDSLLRELRRDERLCPAQCFLDRNLRHTELDQSAFELCEIEDHVYKRHQVLLRLMNPIYVFALIVVQTAVNVLLEDLEISGDRVQRCSKLVTQAREQFRLDAVRGFRFFARGLLTRERDLQLTRALSDSRV